MIHGLDTGFLVAAALACVEDAAVRHNRANACVGIDRRAGGFQLALGCVKHVHTDRSFHLVIDFTQVWIVFLASSQAMSASIEGIGSGSASSK